MTGARIAQAAHPYARAEKIIQALNVHVTGGGKRDQLDYVLAWISANDPDLADALLDGINDGWQR